MQEGTTNGPVQQIDSGPWWTTCAMQTLRPTIFRTTRVEGSTRTERIQVDQTNDDEPHVHPFRLVGIKDDDN